MKFINKTLIILCTLLISVSTFNGNCSNSMPASQNKKAINDSNTINIPLPDYCMNKQISITQDERERYWGFNAFINDSKAPFIPYSNRDIIYSKQEEADIYSKLISGLAHSIAQLKYDYSRHKITRERAEVLMAYMKDILDVLTTEIWEKYYNKLDPDSQKPKRDDANKLMNFMIHYHRLMNDWTQLFTSTEVKRMYEEFDTLVWNIMN